MLANFSKIETIKPLDNMEVLHARLTGRRFPLHFHDTFVIELILAGEDQCDGTGLTAETGQVFVHSPRAAHSGGPAVGKTLEYKAIYPSERIFSELLGMKDCQVPEVSFVSDCKSLFHSVSRYFALENCNVGVRKSQLSGIFSRIRDEALGRHRRHKQRSNEDELRIARRFLMDHCQRDVSIAELSEVTHLSQFHLIREFKKAFGITPRQFLISQRVTLAKKLLAAGMPIANVAQEAGFADQSHLNRCFKRVSGFNPGQYTKGSIAG